MVGSVLSGSESKQTSRGSDLAVPKQLFNRQGSRDRIILGLNVYGNRTDVLVVKDLGTVNLEGCVWKR